MTDQAWIHEVVGRVASEVIETRVAEMREDLVRRTLEEVQPSLSSGGGSEKLLAAVAQVQANTGQRDILNTLLEQSAGFCARSVLFVVQQDSTTAWQAIGFADDDAVREFTLNPDTSLLRHVLGKREPATGSAALMDGHFLHTFGAPVNGECHLMPLFLKDKVAAVLYADAGTANASCERASLDLLVRFTSLLLDAQANRKASNSHEAEPEPKHRPDAASAHAPAPAPSAAAPAAGLPADAPQWSHTAPAAAAAAPAMSAAPPASAPELSAADADTHKRAQRFARLLIDEIKLYSKSKVEDGLKNRDLYDRLKDDIDKSRATYAKRYGQTAAASADYFVQELIRGLAQGDASVLGSNFKH